MNYRIYFFLLSISAALFLAIYFVASFYNRLSADDLYYLGGYSEKGIWGCMSELYFGYSARWAAYLFTGWVVSLSTFNFYHLIFNCKTLLILLIAIYFLIKKYFEYKFKKSPESKLILLYAVLFSAGLFFSSYSISETWFWLVQVCTYLWSIIMSLILLNILVEEKFNFFQIVVIIVASAYIGGASESFALINIFFLFSYFLASNFKFKKQLAVFFPKHQNTNVKILLMLSFLLISFTITMFGPGNEIRYSALPNVTFTQTAWIQIKSFIKIVFIKTPLKLPYIFLFGFPWLVLGKYLSEPTPRLKFIPFLMSIRKYFYLVLILIFIFLVPTSFIMSELGPDRALSQISFLISFCFAILFFSIGYYLRLNEKVFRALKSLTSVLLIGMLGYHLITQFTITKKYAAAYDQRSSFLKELNKSENKTTVELKALPPSGMLYSAEISQDTSHFSNNFFEYALHLKFNTKLKAHN